MGAEDRLRGDIDRLIHVALAAVSPEACLRRAIHLNGDVLSVAGESIDLSQIQRVIVVGMGKASARMAASLEMIIGERIDDGLVVTADGYRVPTERVKVVEASHPVPDERGLAAARQIAQLADSAGENDLVIVLISGGGSALLTYPVDDVKLSELAETNELLLRSGATIQEINTVRKHLSQLKGGRLASRAFPAAVVSLILSDVAGDPLDAIASGPTVPDPTTYADAARIMLGHKLWDEVPLAVRSHIDKGRSGDTPETPKLGDEVFSRVTTAIIGSGIVPTTLELMDRTILDVISDYGGAQFSKEAQAVLLIEVDGGVGAVQAVNEAKPL